MFVLIPNHILHDQTLDCYQKILVGLIHGFALDGKPLKISNKKISEILSCSVRQVQQTLARLKDKKIIEVVENRAGNITTRTVFLCQEWLKITEDAPVQDLHEPMKDLHTPLQKFHPPMKDLHPEYNININLKEEERRESSFNKLPQTPPEVLDLLTKKETMKLQLKDAEIVTDEKGIKRVKLKNGKLQDQKFKNIFLTTQEKIKIKDKFTQEFADEWKFYLIHAFEIFDDWLDNNKTKALALSSHYRTILKWPLAEAKKARLDDLRTFNAESQKERYAR